MNIFIIPASSWIQLAVYFSVLLILVKPLGLYMAKVYQGNNKFSLSLFGWLEKLLYKICGINPEKEMTWVDYAKSVILFSVIGFIVLYAILRLQSILGLNPSNLPNLSSDLAFNTAISFVTNTNWQSYSGETTMSYLSQMLGLTVQNFISAGIGMSVLVALIRGLSRNRTDKIGNFWSDLTKSCIYILLPLSLIMTIALSWQGVPQTLKPYANAQTIESIHIDAKKDDKGAITQPAQEVSVQSIALGPVASQIAIKQLGTNGGGFFNTNSAHPFENPTPLTNFLEMLAILLIPASLCYTFGVMVGDRKQGWVVLSAMIIIFIPLCLFATIQEQKGNPKFNTLNIDQLASTLHSGGNMEGKETRFGILNSTLWASATTAASNGSVNSMHDSFTPLATLVPLLFMQFGEVIFGGVGSGLYGMLIFVIISVFIAGLMVGRTPEYLGKKIQVFDMKMASIVALAPHIATLIGCAIAVVCDAGKAGVFNPYAQGFSEILYAFTSAGNNNGSALAGISANTPFYNIILGIVMLVGRYWVIVPVLAIAGSMAGKNTVPFSAGTLSTTTVLFVGILVSIIIMVGVLTFVPALALGPVAEYFNLIKIN